MNDRWLEADWPAASRVRAGTTYRTGGESLGHYQGLNLALHVEDDAQRVLNNRRQLRQLLSLPAEPHWLEQVHGHNVIEVKHGARSGQTADASYTTQSSEVCVVMTADCLPVLFCDRQATCVAAAHAGWRGLADGILEQTIQHMPVEASSLLAWMGPAIGPLSFEVGADVYETFVKQHDSFISAFTAQGDSKWLMDIYELARQRLHKAGVSSVSGGGRCTYQEQELFYSYRRDRVTGRMASLIWLTDE